MRADGLSEPERRLWMEFSYGTHIDRRTGDPQRDDPAGAKLWGPERLVRAEVIKDLLVGRSLVDERQSNQQGTGQSPAVFLSGARITGQLDLRGLDFAPPLLLQQCVLDEPLVIADSMSRSIRLYGCHLPGVRGSWLKCAGDLHLRDCQINGVVDLAGAYIGGQLVLSGSALSNPGEVAVCGDGLVVAGDFFCRDGADVEGEVSLVAARIGGELRFSKSTLHNPEGIALRADRITVEKDMHCRERPMLRRGFQRGRHDQPDRCPRQRRVQPQQRHAAQSRQCRPARPRLIVDQDMFCRDEFTVDGTVCLIGAHIGGKLSFTSARLTGAILTEAQLSDTHIEQLLTRRVEPVEPRLVKPTCRKTSGEEVACPVAHQQET